MFQRPFEAYDIGSTQSQFAFAFYHEQTFGKLLLKGLDYVGSAIRRAIFYNQDMEYFFQGENGTDDVLDVFPFVVCRNDNDAVRCLHIHKRRF